MIARLLALFAAALLSLAAASPVNAAELSAEQRAAFESVIHDYLMKNPEVIQEAMAELEKRQQEGQKVAQATAVQSERETIFNSTRQAVVGNPAGDVTLVEFFDYNCPYCKKAETDLTALLKADPKLRVVLKDFPVLGPDSVEASQYAIAARNQLKGEKIDFHQRLMGAKGRASKAGALAVAKDMGLDIVKLQKDADSAETRASITEVVSLGDKLALTGTPAFVVGDEVVFGAVGVDALRASIGNVRKCGKATCS